MHESEMVSAARTMLRRTAARIGLKGNGAGAKSSGPHGPALPASQLQHFPADHPKPGQDRWPWPRLLEHIDTPWMRVLRELYGMQLSFPYSLSPEAGLLLHSIVRNTRPRVMLEIGTNIGISAIWMAAAIEGAGDGAVLHCFDRFQPPKDVKGEYSLGNIDRETFVKDRFRAAGLDHLIRTHRGDSAATVVATAGELVADARARGLDNSSGVQLAFIDGDHTHKGVWRDFEAVEPLLDTGGLVVLHDTFPVMCNWRGPRLLMHELHSRAKGRYQLIDMYLSPVNYGLGLLRRMA